jgi:hypothetical protein
MPTKLGKNGQILGGERAEIRSQNVPKKITVNNGWYVIKFSINLFRLHGI